MTTDHEPVDRAELAARINILTRRTPFMEGQSVESYLQTVVALAGPERRLDVDQLPEEDARTLWLLTDAIANDNGLVWDDADG